MRFPPDVLGAPKTSGGKAWQKNTKLVAFLSGIQLAYGKNRIILPLLKKPPDVLEKVIQNFCVIRRKSLNTLMFYVFFGIIIRNWKYYLLCVIRHKVGYYYTIIRKLSYDWADSFKALERFRLH